MFESHKNRYYIVNSEDPNLQQIESVIVGLLEKQRTSNDETLIAVKLHREDHKQYEFLQEYKEYDNKGIFEVMNTKPWYEISKP